jgi:hypothetical protein
VRFVTAALLAACGGDARTCEVEVDGIGGELGTIDTADHIFTRSPAGENLFLEIYLEPPGVEIYDSLRLELYGGEGVFADGAVRPGTFALEGAEAVYDECGACLFLLADQDLATRTPARTFMPGGGTLVLERVSGRLAGRLEDVELREVTIDRADPDGPGPLRPTLATRDVDGGCRARLDLAAFDAEIE